MVVGVMTGMLDSWKESRKFDSGQFMVM